MDNTRITVQATDPLTRAGLAEYLASSALTVLPATQRAHAQVLVMAAPEITPELVAVLRRSSADFGIPAVLVIADVSKVDLLLAEPCRVVAVLPRAQVTAAALVRSVQIAATRGDALPAALSAELFTQIERMLEHHGLRTAVAGFSPREVDVLRLVSDGLNVAEIAGQLCYSERTVKKALSSVLKRLHLKNRVHAVAYALRAGVI